MLMSTITVMHGKNSQLEELLNLEKATKLDMFSAIEEARKKIKTFSSMPIVDCLFGPLIEFYI